MGPGMGLRANQVADGFQPGRKGNTWLSLPVQGEGRVWSRETMTRGGVRDMGQWAAAAVDMLACQPIIVREGEGGMGKRSIKGSSGHWGQGGERLEPAPERGKAPTGKRRIGVK